MNGNAQVTNGQRKKEKLFKYSRYVLIFEIIGMERKKNICGNCKTLT